MVFHKGFVFTRFTIKQTRQVVSIQGFFMLLLILSACTATPNKELTLLAQTTYSCDEYDSVLIDAQIVRVEGEYTYNEEVIFTESSRGTVSLLGGFEGGDWLQEYQIDTVFSPVPELPFRVSICGPEDALTATDHRIDVVLEQDPSQSTVGDLITEDANNVNPPDNIDVEVSGLESCDAENSGGFCL